MTFNEKLALATVLINAGVFLWGMAKIATTAAISQEVVKELTRTSLNHEKRISRLEGANDVREDS